jgi:hypothetical protein
VSEHEHVFELLCWICEERAECLCGACDSCGSPENAADILRDMDEAERKGIKPARFTRPRKVRIA